MTKIRRKPGFIIAGLFISLLLLVMLTGCPSNNGENGNGDDTDPDPTQVLVPDVTGLTQAAAETDILASNLTMGTVTPQNSNVVAAGLVISQSPAAGASVDESSAVNIVLSTGPAQVIVPAVTGMTQAAAETAITGADLTVGTLSSQNSDTVAAGSVISQNPASGASVDQGSAVDLVLSLGPAAGLPPDPSTVATSLSEHAVTSFHDGISFLYTGADPIQTGVDPADMVEERAAVLRGKVMDRNGDPVSGVTVTFLHHPEFGQTLTRADGCYDLAANGGGVLVLQYAKTGYLTVQRRNQVPWRDFTVMEDVVMTPLDTLVTTVQMNSGAMQSARGSVVADDQGTRQATILFPAGTQATLVLSDGSTQSAGTLNVRATEYTVGATGPAAMPAELPDATGYTYCVDLTADEAVFANAQKVIFSQPVYFYVEDVFGFPVGSAVPAGYYNRQTGEWEGSENGRVVNMVSITGGLADLDTDGDGNPDDAATLDVLGVTEAERAELALLFPAPPRQLWRVPVQHFTPWDCNFPYGPDDDAAPPNRPVPRSHDPEDDPCPERGSSVIGVENQTLGEAIPIAGTDFSLVYRSDRANTGGYWVDISLTGESIPNSLKRVELTVGAGGKKFKYIFGAAPNMGYTFFWDGIDAYGRQQRGEERITIRIGYVYQLVYYPVLEAWEYAWARLNGALASGGYSGISSDREITLWQAFKVSVPSYGFTLNGWELNVHHLYDPDAQILYKGDGSQKSAAAFSAKVIHPFAGNGTRGYTGDDGFAADAQLYGPYSTAVAPDGSVYIADFNNHVIRRVDRDGIITTEAGNGTLCDSLYEGMDCGDGGPAVDAGLNFPTGVAFGPDGSWYISDAENCRIRKVDPDGIITTFAGGGEEWEDGADATAAQLGWIYGKMAVADDGSVLMPDCFFSDCRIRKVDPGGKIWTILEPDYGGDNIALGPDGAVFYTGDNEVYRMGTDGITATVAGTGTTGYSGDGGPAVDADIRSPTGITVADDGSFYFTERSNYLVRYVNTAGIIYTLAGTGDYGGIEDGVPSARSTFDNPIDVSLGQSGELYVTDEDDHLIARVGSDFPGYSTGACNVPDGNLVYHFDANGRHLSTTHALTGAPVYVFFYDGQGRLTTIQDIHGNETTFGYDANSDLAAIVAPHAQVTSFEVNAAGMITAISYPSGAGHTFSYEEDLMTSRMDPNGQAYSYTYDEKGLLTSTTDPLDAQKTLERTASSNGYKVILTTPEGIERTYQVADTAGEGKQITNTLGCCQAHETTTTPDGTQTSVYADGTTVTTTYSPSVRWGMTDPIPETRLVSTPGGRNMTVSYAETATFNTPGDVLDLATYNATTRVNGKTYGFSYDGETHTFLQTTPESRTVAHNLDSSGRVVQYQQGTLAQTAIGYDTYGRISTIAQGQGADTRTMTFAYDGDGELETFTDAMDRVLRQTVNADGRVIELAGSGGRTVGYGYDANGHVTSVTTPGGSVHGFRYNAVGSLTAYEMPGGDKEITYSYNLDRRLTEVQLPGYAVVQMSHDATGRTAAVSLPDDRSILYGRDSDSGRVTSISHSDGTDLAYTYDGFLPLAETWSGRVSGTASFTFDNNFRLASQSVNGGSTVNYQYDDDGAMTQAGALAIQRHADNSYVTGTDLSSVTTAHTWNAFGEPASLWASFNATSLFSATYDRDKLGRITNSTVSILEESPVQWTYTYDAAGRLTHAANGTQSRTYGYDANGNRTSFDDGTEILATYDGEDRLLTYGDTTYDYLPSGELYQKTTGSNVTTYTCDPLGNLLSVDLPDSTAIDYDVDGRGRRIAKSVDGTVTWQMIYQDRYNPVAQMDGSGSMTARFVYGPQSLVPDYMIKGGITYRIISGPLGSVRLVVNAATGAVVQRLDYDEFGNVRLDTNPGFQPFGFAGGIYDPDTGLVRFGCRDYDPVTGRWTAKDPLLFYGNDTNFYAYAKSDPVNRIDPMGLVSRSDCWNTWEDIERGLEDLKNLDPEQLDDYQEMLKNELERLRKARKERPWPDTLADAAAGWGDDFTSIPFTGTSLTEAAREALGCNYVIDKNSNAYKGGKAEAAILGAGISVGKRTLSSIHNFIKSHLD